MEDYVPTYDELRRRNIADNKRILAELGLGDPGLTLTPEIKESIGLLTHEIKESKLKFKASIRLAFKRPSKPANKKRQPKRPVETDGDENTQRKSARLSGQTRVKYEHDEDWVEEDYTDRKRKPRTNHVTHHVTSPPHVKVPPNRPNHYGPVEGVDVGTTWLTRMECCRDGIHRPPVSGIHSGVDGAYSIALSGGYDDNIDWGECFTYTGEGGRDLKGTAAKPKNLRTAPQSKDQTLSRGNLALSRNVDTGNPVRVIRGYKLNSAFAPEEGYRYDGLYAVEKAWYTTGVSGFGVWKFAMRRLEDQAPPPWEFIEKNQINSPKDENDNCAKEEEDVVQSGRLNEENKVEELGDAKKTTRKEELADKAKKG